MPVIVGLLQPKMQQFHEACFCNQCVSAKFILHMHRERASGQNSDTTVGLGDFDFLYGMVIMVNRGQTV